MQVGVEAIVEVGVRLPDLLQHLHVEAQLVDHQVVRALLQSLKSIFTSFLDAIAKQVVSSSAKWCREEPSEAKWSQVELGGARWSQVEPSGAKWS